LFVFSGERKENLPLDEIVGEVVLKRFAAETARQQFEMGVIQPGSNLIPPST
jgi:hypothetical protein